MVQNDSLYICSSCQRQFSFSTKDIYPEAVKLGLIKRPYCNSCLKNELLKCQAYILSTPDVVPVMQKVGGNITSYPVEISKLLSPREKEVIANYGGHLFSIGKILQLLEENT